MGVKGKWHMWKAKLDRRTSSSTDRPSGSLGFKSDSDLSFIVTFSRKSSLILCNGIRWLSSIVYPTARGSDSRHHNNHTGL
jgi:hypothetical protein